MLNEWLNLGWVSKVMSNTKTFEHKLKITFEHKVNVWMMEFQSSDTLSICTRQTPGRTQKSKIRERFSILNLQITANK